jgi:hypothetical protein
MDVVSACNCIIIKFGGTIGAEDFLKAVLDIESSDGYKPSMNRLFDYRFAGTNFGTSDVVSLSGWAHTRGYANQHRKVAHLAEDDATFGLLRVLIAHSSGFSSNLLVTRDPEEACNWVGLTTKYALD